MTSDPRRKIVTVFGSRYPRSEDPEYDAARRLGRLLAEQGYTICTGGYTGIMEASSRGAREAQGHTIGVTVESFRGAVNSFVVEEIRTKNLFSRLEKLMALGQAYVVFRGGMGTLAELSLAWNLVQMGQIPSSRPIFLVGTFWNRFLEEWKRSTDTAPQDYALLTVVTRPEEIAAVLGMQKSV
ncbi:MAG: LOG family protein [Acidobacteriia bacterium]|nr:LOG family protein [Terriglobia bacterium]